MYFYPTPVPLPEPEDTRSLSVLNVTFHEEDTVYLESNKMHLIFFLSFEVIPSTFHIFTMQMKVEVES